MAADPGHSAWQDFGQRVDLTARIREILINYPEGTSVFKELVQNADDAKATCVRFCLDHRSFPTERLLSPNLAEFQGPALYVYNDGLFNEKDFQSISNIGNSTKREQVGKTGRFGVGFNACYHLTDLPSFVSGSDLVVFDPHVKFLPNVSSSNPGKRINFVANPGALQAAADTAAPHAMWGCDLRTPLRGTFFRFPLRTAAHAMNSTISKQAYTPGSVSALLGEFAAELQLVLLFLKSVTHISIEEILVDDQGLLGRTALDTAAWGPPPCQGVHRKLVATCSLVEPVTVEVAQQRALFTAAAVADPKERVAGTYRLSLSSRSGDGTCDTSHYLISQARGTGPVAALAEKLSSTFQAPILPWAAVAAPLSGSALGKGGNQDFVGQAFCFLPLPVELQLPVHINGFFELSSNRRDVWAPGAGLAGAGAARAQWNLELLRGVVAPAYFALLQGAAQQLSPEAFYRLWPHHELRQPWQVVVEALYPLLALQPLIWTPAGNGAWLTASQVLFPDTTWDGGAPACPDLVAALLALGLPLAQLPPELLSLLKRFGGVQLQHVRPAVVRRTLRRKGASACSDLGRSEQLVPLVAYTMSDCDCSLPIAVDELSGCLPLPMLDGTLHLLSQQQAPLAFVLTNSLEEELVGKAGKLLVDTRLCGDGVTYQLQALAAHGSCSLRLLSAAALVSVFLPQLLPAHWRGSAATLWDGAAAGTPGSPAGTQMQSVTAATSAADTSSQAADSAHEQGSVAAAEQSASVGVTREWIQSLWSWCASHPEALPLLAESPYPVLPITGGRLVQLQQQRLSPVLLPHKEWPEGLAEVLQQCGCLVLDIEHFELPAQLLLGPYIHDGDGPGVAAALWVALGGAPAALKPQAVKAYAPGSGSPQPELAQLMNSAAAAVSAARGLLRDTVANLAAPTTGPGHSPQPGARDAAALPSLRAAPVAELPPASKQLLRSYLLQPRWFAAKGGTPHSLLLLLVQLPVFSTARSSVQVAALDADEAGESSTVQLEFVTLIPAKSIAPAGVEPRALGTSFLGGLTPAEAALMQQHLGVSAPAAATVLCAHVLPQLTQLDPEVQLAAVMGMLSMLPTLHNQDPAFLQHVSQVPFVPDASGVFRRPSELYDPRVPELRALLDPATAFPAAALCGSSAGAGVLPQLQQLGLRTSADLGTLVLAARYVQHTAQVEGDDELAAARGKALLSYLDSEAESLVGAMTAVTAAAAAATAADAARQGKAATLAGTRRPGLGLLSAVTDMLAAVTGDPAQTPPHSGMGQEPLANQQQQLKQQKMSEAWAELKRLRWCPALSCPPHAVLPRPGNQQATKDSAAAVSSSRAAVRLVAPCSARPAADAWLVSSVMDLVDGDVRSAVLRDGLGWSAPLSGAVLGSQLAALGTMYPAVVSADTGNGRQELQLASLASDVAQQLASNVPSLYGALASLPSQEVAAAAGVLQGGNSIWVGSGFAAADKVAFKGALDLSPFLFVLPLQLTPFWQLLSAFGAAEAFSAAQYASLLRSLASVAAGKSLSPQQLSLALTATEQLADILGASGGGATSGAQANPSRPGGSSQAAAQDLGDLLLPDEEGIQRPTAQLVFNDAPWLDAEAAGANVMHLVHPRVSAPVATALGVASLRRLMLVAAADTMSLSLVKSGGAVEAWGQSEDLTSRLKHILQDYPEGPSVLLELVQNADDAGASRVSFTLDATSYGTGSVLGPAMAAWQGPALLAFNDAVFSPGDFQAIARIGQDGKMGQPAAIGRFGLGFNAVYHLTDLPSFVSGSHLVMFDPHAAWLPGATPAQPGLRLRLSAGNLADQFPDAFAPYQHYGCTMRGSFNGTLFRLPLRTEATATSSSIKAQPSSVAEVKQLLEALKEQLPLAMLFLKSVREVEVNVLDAGTSQGAQLLFRATTQPLDGSEPLQAPLVRFVSAGGGGSGQQQLDALYGRLAAAAAGKASLPSSEGRVQLRLEVGPAAGTQLASAVVLRQEDWLVCNQFATGAALQQAVATWKSSRIKLLPWVGVAAPIASTTTDGIGGKLQAAHSSCEGRAFCFLPLPVRTSLPVHINGFFELSSNRRDVWAPSSDMSGQGAARAQWNLRLLEDGVGPAYSRLLGLAAQHLGPSSGFWRCFPGTDVRAPWQSVVPVVYSSLSSTTMLHTPAGGGRWLAPSSVLLPSKVLLQDDSIEQVAQPGQQLGEEGLGSRQGQAVEYNLLGRLLLAAGLPLAGGLGSEQLACLARYTPGVTTASPAAARRLFQQLALGAGQAGVAAPDRQLAQPHDLSLLPQLEQVLAAEGSGAVAGMSGRQRLLELLLKYCLSDLPATGVPASPPQHPSAAAAAQEASASISASAPAQGLLQASFVSAVQQLGQLPLLLLRSGAVCTFSVAAQPARAPAAQQCWVVASEAEAALLEACPDMVLVQPADAQLQQQLLAIACSGHSNLMRVSTRTVSEHLLPRVLPAAWHRQAVVDWRHASTATHALPAEAEGGAAVDPPAAAATPAPAEAADAIAAAIAQPAGAMPGPRPAFLAQLWQCFADCSAQDLAALAAWPLVPLQGGRLHAPVQPARLLRPGPWGPDVSAALSRAAVQLLDDTLLPHPCPVLDACVQPATAAGVLSALPAAVGAGATGPAHVHIAQQIEEWSPAERRQLRSYLLAPAWFEPDSPCHLAMQQQQLLKQLPIFELHASTAVDRVLAAAIGSAPAPGDANPAVREQHGVQQLQQTLTGRFVALLPEQQQPLMLAPQGMPAALLGSQYLRSDSDAQEAVLQQHLGVPRQDITSFLLEHVAVAADQLDAGALAGAAALLLRRLDQEPALLDIMGQLPIIPTRDVLPGGRHQLAAPRQLVDPAQPALAVLFGPRHLPAPPFDGSAAADAALLQQLARCGLRTEITLQVLVDAAEELADAASKSAKSPEAVQQLHTRAGALLAELDRWACTHAEETLAAADRLATGSTEEISQQQRRNMLCWQQLRNISWCPVMQQPAQPGMPWPDSSPSSGLLFPPRLVRPARDAWLCSAALRILQGSAGLQLCAVLGWDVPLRGSVLVAQLTQLSKVHPVVPASAMDSQRELSEHQVEELTDRCAALYNALGTAIQGAQGQSERQLLEITIPDSAVVWIGRGFAQGSTVRMAGNSQQQQQQGAGAVVTAAAAAAMAAELLWLVPPPLAANLTPAGQSVLELAGVQAEFSCLSFLHALNVLAARYPADVPLPEAQVQLAVQLAEAAGSLTAELDQLPPVMLPDAAGVMQPASQLFTPDAPWLLEEGGNASAWALVAPGISISTASALGAQSMREQQDVQQQADAVPTIMWEAALSGAALVGVSSTLAAGSRQPSSPTRGSAEVTDRQAATHSCQQTVLQVLLDLLEVADVAASSMLSGDVAGPLQLHVLLDERQHPRQRVLHQGLAACQGPALLISLPGSARSAVDIAALLGWGKMVAAAKNSSQVSSEHATGGVPLGGWKLASSRVGYGAALAGCWALSDVVQMLGGDTLCIWDPSGRYIGTAAAGRQATQAVAQQFNLADGKLLERFPHQFAPWQHAAQGLSDDGSMTCDVPGTALRLPLRAAPAASSAVASAGGLPLPAVPLACVRQALARWLDAAASSLPLLSALSSVVVEVWPAGANCPVPLGAFSTTATDRPGMVLIPATPEPRGVAPAPAASSPESRHSRHSSPFSRLVKVPNLVKRGLQSLGLQQGVPSPGSGNSPRASSHSLRSSAGGSGGQVLQVTLQQHVNTDVKASLAAGRVAAPSDQTDGSTPTAANNQSTEQQDASCTSSTSTWLVSYAQSSQPAASSRSRAGAAWEWWDAPLGAVAVQLMTSEDPVLVPSPGLATLVAQPCMLQPQRHASPEQQADSPHGNASCFTRQGFTMAGNLLLMHGCNQDSVAAVGPGRVLPSNSTLVAVVTAEAASRPSGQPGFTLPGAANRPAADALPPAIRHNAAVLEVVESAWLQLLQWTAAQQAGLLAADNAYQLLLPGLLEAEARGATDASVLFKKMLRSAADCPVWRLHSGQCVYLQQGMFLQPGIALSVEPPAASPTPSAPSSPAGLIGLGGSARGFLQRHMPLFQVHYSATLQLEAGGVSNLRLATPPVLRPLLRRWASAAQREAAAFSGHAGGPLLPATGPFADCSMDAALELLAYCTSDLPEAVAAATSEVNEDRPPPAAAANAQSQLPAQRQGTGAPDLFPGLLAAVGEGLNQIHAVGETFLAGVLAQAPPPQQQPQHQQVVPAGQPREVRLGRAHMQELQGLPVPLHGGGLAVLGPLTPSAGDQRSRGLWILPPSCQQQPEDLFAAGCFLHEGAVAALGEQRLQLPWFRHGLGLQLYGLTQLAAAVQAKYATIWSPEQLAGSMTLPWSSTPEAGPAAPSAPWLQQLWQLAFGLQRAAVPWGVTVHADVWAAFKGLQLLPLADGQLLSMSTRSCLLVAPEQQTAAEAGTVDLSQPVGDITAWLQGQPQPRSWLLPELAHLGMPLLHPGWQRLLGELAEPQPAVRRPPFLGPLVTKMMEATAAGLLQQPQFAVHLDDASSIVTNCGWGSGTLSGRLFELLAAHPPRDLGEAEVAFLRGLPLFTPLYPQDLVAMAAAGAPAIQQHEQQLADMAAAGTLRVAASGQQLLLLPTAVVDQLRGPLALLPIADKSRLLAHQPGWGEMLSVMGLEPATSPATVQQLMLPHLLGDHQQLKGAILAVLLQHWSSWRGNEVLADALKQLSFVPGAAQVSSGTAASGNGRESAMFKPSQLYDPTSPLFKGVVQSLLHSAAQQPSVGAAAAAATAGVLPALPAFPLPPLNSGAGLVMLRDLGMISNVTPEVFLALVQLLRSWVLQMLEATIGGMSQTLQQQRLQRLLPDGSIDITPLPPDSRAAVERAALDLLSYLRQHHGGLGAPPAWWSSLGDTAWVPAWFGPPGCETRLRVLTSFKMAAAAQDWPLAWASCPLLDPQQQLPGVMSMGLGFKSPPAFLRVMAHVNQFAEAGAQQLLRPGCAALEPDLGTATLRLLQHLHREGPSPGQLEALAGANPWLPLPGGAGGLLVGPSSLFFKLPGVLGLAGGLAPFAWEVPSAWTSVTPLLEQLGVKNQPSPAHLLLALQRFGARLGPRPLNPNELAATLRLLGHLAGTTPAPASSYPSAAGAGGTSSQAWPPGAAAMVLVPAADGRLMPVSQVASVSSSTAGRWLGRCDPSQLTLVHPQLPDHVVRWAGVSPLEELLTEELEEEGVGGSTPQQQLEELDGWNRQQLVAWLTSTELATAVAAVAAGTSSSGSRLRQLTPWGVQRALVAAVAGRGGGRGLVLVPTLRTCLLLIANRRDITAGAAARQVYEFWDAKSRTVYLAAPPPGLRLSGLLAALVSRVVGATGVLPLHPLLEPGAPQHVTQLGSLLTTGGGSADVWGAAADVGQVGAPLSAADRQLVVLAPLRPYCGGELVAISCRPPADPAAAAAAAADARAGAGGQAAAASSSALPAAAQQPGGWQLVYGRVVEDCAPRPGAAAYLVAVEVAPGEVTQLLSSQVFAFASRVDVDADLAGDGAAPGEAAAAGASAPTSAAGVAAGAGAGGGNTGGTGQSNADRAGLYGGVVGAQQVAGAVTDMLAAAGLPLDLERQQLLQQALSAQQALAAAKAELAAATSRTGELTSQLEAAQRNWTCRICFTAQVNAAFAGCGHTFCSRCAGSVRRCPVCRKESGTIKLYS